ncbi:MAG: MFS transporter [Myxococcales bacterium]|nr:MFS transporter [Myxococcales bacterium]
MTPRPEPAAPSPVSPRPRLLERLALAGPERKAARAWVAYDWANSAFITIVVAAVFPPWFVSLAAGPGATEAMRAQATGRLSLTTVIALSIIALASPLLGAIGDRAPIKKRMIAGFTLIGAGATAAMWFVGPGDATLALILFAIGNIAANGAFVFYDSLLPHVAPPDELDRVSTAGYALGYLGGGLLLAFNLAMILKPALFGLTDAGAAIRISFLLTAAWWLLFAIPLLRHVREPIIVAERRTASTATAVREGLRDLAGTWRELRRFPQAGLMLLAFLIYNDGIGTIIRMATAYGQEIGLAQGDLILALVIVQLVGIPASFAFGQLAGRVGARRSIFLGLVAYTAISVLGYLMTTAVHFFVLAGLVGLVQGGVQALSRSLFASLIPRHRSSEFFGLFAVFEKFAGILGPGLFYLANEAFGSSRPAILGVIIFFVGGGLILSRVDIAAGQRTARAAEATVS